MSVDESGLRDWDLAQRIRAARHKREHIDVLALLNGPDRTARPSIDLLLEAAQYLAWNARPEDALKLARQAQAGAPGSDERARCSVLIAHYLIKMGDFAEAEAETRRALQGCDRRSDLLETLGLIDARRSASAISDPWERYWAQRRDFAYVHMARQLIRIVGHSARAVADVGSNRTPILDFFERRPRKYSIDPTTPYEGEGVIPVREDYLAWTPPEPIDVATCFQVMEHIPNVGGFARALLAKSEVVLISVPYMEAPGANPGHIHSMIDLDRIKGWFGRMPNFHYIAQELSGDRRILCLFDVLTDEPIGELHTESRAALRFRVRWSS